MKHLVIFSLMIFLLLPISSVYGESEDPVYFLDIQASNSKYIIGQNPMIFGTIRDANGTGITTQVSIVVEDKKTGIEEEPQYADAKNGRFVFTKFSSDYIANYAFSANHPNSVNSPSTVISFVDFPQTKIGMGIFLTIGFLVGLLILIGVNPKRIPVTISEPIRFALLTLVSIIPLITFVALDAELGQSGVFGVVLQYVGDSSVADPSNFRWIMHFGGHVGNDYQSGIVVPIYILVFGMIGGYLRFLYKTQRGWFVERAKYEIKRTQPDISDTELLSKVEDEFKKAESKSENSPIGKRIIFNNSMEDLSLIFLPPILAVATYFMLLQGGLDPEKAMPTFAVVSFAIGLISNEIVKKLESFARFCF